ncbi:hypothetical protein DDD64_02325 [Actinotignum sanguinis]|uniref:LPXTG cell wall anchor domain-containing protein n=1 Tax=Actinotignum sanguinis TaxID=1445614 RepID=UPI000F7EA661|nr:LPXTG cell wall anchor domain-containing protein [Actinotignum sanguinis]RTE51118.1 hypothetical protein DDD64_02325 [Actinotignum sanguinis]
MPATLSFDSIPWTTLVYHYEVRAMDSKGQETSDPNLIVRYRVTATLLPALRDSYSVIVGDSGWDDAKGISYEFDAAPNCQAVIPRAPELLPAPQQGGYGMAQAPYYSDDDPQRDLFVYTIANGGYNAAGQQEENGAYALVTVQLTETAAKRYRIGAPTLNDSYQIVGEEARWVLKLPFVPFWEIPDSAPSVGPLPSGYPSAFVPSVAPSVGPLPSGYPSAFVPSVAPSVGPLPTGHPESAVPTAEAPTPSETTKKATPPAPASTTASTTTPTTTPTTKSEAATAQALPATGGGGIALSVTAIVLAGLGMLIIRKYREDTPALPVPRSGETA